MVTATQRRGHDETETPSKPSGPGRTLVDPANFLLATRDTGYKTTALAIVELIDNSLQAAATEVQIEVAAGRDDEFPLEISVTDNGSGMGQDTLARALITDVSPKSVNSTIRVMGVTLGDRDRPRRPRAAT